LAAALACACLLSACASPSGDTDNTTDTTLDGTPAESTMLTEPEETTDTAPESDEVPEESTATETETETETEAETEAETEPEPFPPTVTYHSMPLLGKDDTTGRLAILDYPEEANKGDRIVFQIQPTDKNGKYVDAHTIVTPADSHVLVLSYVNKADGIQSFDVLQESTSTRITDNGQELRTVEANCYRLAFFPELTPITQNHSAYSTTFNGAGHTVSYTEQTMFSQLAVAAPMLSRIPVSANHLLSDINTTDYDVTVLYSHENGEVQVNVPVTEIPTFSWDILKEHAKI
jgi:hypothetical protein